MKSYYKVQMKYPDIWDDFSENDNTDAFLNLEDAQKFMKLYEGCNIFRVVKVTEEVVSIQNRVC